MPVRFHWDVCVPQRCSSVDLKFITGFGTFAEILYLCCHYSHFKLVAAASPWADS